MKKVTLNHVGYYISGLSDLTLWGGGNANIEMKPFTVKRLREIRTKINDNGFGVQNINGAICDVYDLYEHNYKEYNRTITINKISEYTFECYINR